MGRFFKPSIKRAVAGTEIDFGNEAVFVTWHGDEGTLVRAHSIYLDWAVNKDNRAPAIDFLAAVLEFLDGGPDDRFAAPPVATLAWPHLGETVAARGTVTIAYTEQMRCKAAFRPRTAILTYLYPTFWALWNELVLRASDEPGAIEAFVDDLRTQIDYYDKHGIGMRGGVAPIWAAQVGGSSRLAQEVAEFHGLTLAEFRALPQKERHRLTDAHTDHDLRESGLFAEDEIERDAELPSNPLLQDEVSLQLFNEILEGVGARWDELYAEDQNPTLTDTSAGLARISGAFQSASSLHEALVLLRGLTAQHPNEGVELSEDALNAVWSIGSAGYCWRLAEEQTRDGPDEDYLEEIERVMADLPDVPPREQVSRNRLLMWGAGECANRGQTADFRIWAGCPVGFGVQFDFFKTAFDRLTDIIVPAEIEVTTPDLLYAFTYGLALRDVERWLDQHPT